MHSHLVLVIPLGTNDITITAGGAGTTVTGQFVVGLTLD